MDIFSWSSCDNLFFQVTREGPMQCEQHVKKSAQWATSSLKCASIQTSFLQVFWGNPNDPFTLTQNSFKSKKWHSCLSLYKGILFPEAEREATKLQERLLREAASFIITDQIPDFVRRSTACILPSAPLQKLWNNLITKICMFVNRWIGASIPMRRQWTELLSNRLFTREASICGILDMWSKPSASQNMWEAWGT